ncbi:MAG: GNAT family N-acetyltransferase [Lachnospiraceae bacterium]|nr:GNAT family N-acetyltransferase [Lachnospiraceae bacterium]
MHTSYRTKRLDLRILKPGDENTVLDFYRRNRDFLEPVEPTRIENFYTAEYQRNNLYWEYNAFVKFKYLRMWIFLHDEPTPLGCICFSEFQKSVFCRCMLGYKLDKTACHHGYMLEALGFLLPIVAKEYSVRRIEAMVMPNNIPSIRLLERLGFVKEGYLHSFAQINGSIHDHLLYTYITDNGINQ